MPAPAPPIPGNLAAWEANYGPGLRASHRDLPEPPAAGLVYTGRDLPAQRDPIVTGGLRAHQVCIGYQSTYLRDWLPGRRPHHDGPTVPGTLFVIPPEVLAEGGRAVWDGGSAFALVMLPPATVARAAAELGHDYERLAFPEGYSVRDPLAAALVTALGRELDAGGPGGRVYADQLTHTLAVQLVRAHSRPRGNAAAPATRALDAPRGGLAPRALRITRDYVRHALADPDLSLDDLAAAAGYSPFHFARSFRVSTGETPAGYLRRVRLEHAAELLASSPELTVAQVAERAGYRSASAFAAAFRRVLGVSPSAYQRARR